MSLIFPNLFLGDRESGCPDSLGILGVSHVVIAAGELDMPIREGVTYLHLPLQDDEEESLFPHVEDAYEFIDRALWNNGRVLVHCLMGVSRSPSVLIYYLMRKYGMTYQEALDLLQEKRPLVWPNKNYAQQLQQWHSIMRD